MARIDPTTNALQATIPIGGVGDVAESNGHVWVSSYSANSVGEVDLATNTVPHPIHVDGPSGLAVGQDAVWVVSPVRGTVTRIDPGTDAVVETITVAHPAPGLTGLAVPGAGSVAVGGGAVWATMENWGHVARIDPTTNRIVATVDAGSYPSIAFAANALWIGRDDQWEVQRIDPATNRVAASIPLPATPYDLSAGGGVLWVAGDGLLAEIDTTKNTIAQRLLATDGIYAGVAADSDLWAARLATQSSIGSYDPDAHVLHISTMSPAVLPVRVTRGIPYTQPVACGRYSGPSGTCSLQADVYSQPDADDQPVIVLAHGGWCSHGCRAYLAQLASALSLEGMVVFNVDYRQGKQSTDSYRDLACAIRFARANASTYGGDPSRITLVGQSNGARVGATVALGGNAFHGGCLANGSAFPNAFVALSGAPMPGTRSYVGGNHDLAVRYLVGSNDVPNVAGMRRFVRTLRSAGYDASFKLVKGADHYSLYTPGTASPTLRVILNVARDP